jgi:hypothetical protein
MMNFTSETKSKFQYYQGSCKKICSYHPNKFLSRMDFILGHQRKDLLENIKDCNSQQFIQKIKQLKDKRD